MDKVLFQKLERLKEELFYLKTNKPELLKKLKASIEAKKISERSVYLCTYSRLLKGLTLVQVSTGAIEQINMIQQGSVNDVGSAACKYSCPHERAMKEKTVDSRQNGKNSNGHKKSQGFLDRGSC